MNTPPRARGRPRTGRTPRVQLTTIITEEQIVKLRKMAGAAGCKCRRGPFTGTPSINLMLKMLAVGQLGICDPAGNQVWATI